MGRAVMGLGVVDEEDVVEALELLAAEAIDSDRNGEDDDSTIVRRCPACILYRIEDGRMVQLYDEVEFLFCGNDKGGKFQGLIWGKDYPPLFSSFVLRIPKHKER